MSLIQRITDILLKPKETWPAIAQEPADVASIYSRYLLFVALIPAVCGFIGLSIVGVGGFGFNIRLPLLTGLVNMVVSYVLSLALVFLLALVTDALAPSFGGSKNQVNALKLVAYASTAGFVGGVFSLLPSLSMLGLLASLYSVYLVYTGIALLMRCPPEKAAGYTAAVVVCGIVAMVLMGAVASFFMPRPGMHLGSLPGGNSVSIQTPGGEVKLDAAKMEAAAKRMEEAGKRLEKAQASGDGAAAGKAMSEMMGAMGNATGGATPLPAEALKAALPAALGALPRESIESQGTQSIGVATSFAKASYKAGAQSVDLSVVDLGGLAGLAAAWSQTTLDRDTPEKTEKVYKQGDRTVREESRKDGSASEVRVLLGNGVMVEAKGRGVDAPALKALLAGVDLGQIENLKRTAAKP